MHASELCDKGRKGLSSDSRQEAKTVGAKAKDHAVEMLLLLMLLCSQKLGRSAAGFSEQDLRTCAENSDFPFTILRLLKRLNWKEVASDLRVSLAKASGPRSWLGKRVDWADPLRTMESSLFGLVFS